MDAEVTRLAVAEFTRIAPAARMNAGVIATPGGRANIGLPIQCRRRRGRSRKSFSAAVITVDVHVSNLPKFAAFDIAVARFENVRGAAPFQAYLHGSFIFSRGGNHRLPFDYVVA